MMKRKTVIAITFLVMLLFVPLDVHGVSNKEKADNNEVLKSKRVLNNQGDFDLPSGQPTLLYEDHSPIEIYNDSAFDLYSFDGSGNSTHPYLIENYNITDSSGILIHIENTTAWFLINDCYLNGTGASSDGIVLKNVTHGTIHKNTICDTVVCGIFLENSSRNTLTDNTIYDCESGIELLSISYINTLSGNTIYNCSSYGIHLDSSYYCSISDNPVYNCSLGIQLEGAENNTLSGNAIYNCSSYGIDLVQSSKNNTLSGNAIYNCSVDGIRLYSFSDKNTLLGNIIYNCSDDGIELTSYSSYNNITGNTIHNCSGNGINIYIPSNTISHIQNNTVHYNNIFNNTQYGLYLSLTENCTVNWNNFVSNNNGGTQAYDNHYKLTNIIRNNYWDDYLGDGSTPYDLDGGTISNDSSPLVIPVLPIVQIISPISQEYGADTIAVSLFGTPNLGQYRYYIAGIDENNQTWIGNIGRTLPDGTYTLHAYGTFLGYTGYDSVTFTIDAVLPTIIIDSPSAAAYATDTITVALSGSGVDYFWYYIAGVDSANQSWTTAVQQSLADGTYTLHAYSNDSAGNEVHTSVTFTIDTIAPTIVIDSPTATTYATDTITVTLSGSGVDHFWYYIAGVDSQNQTWTPTGAARTLSDGTYTLHAFGNDTAGNIGHTAVTFTFDTIAPVVNITSPTNTTYKQNTVTLNYTVSDGIVTIYLNGTANDTSIPSGSTVTDIPNGIYNITIVAIDAAGNIGKATVICTIATTQKKSDDSSFPGMLMVLLFLITIVAVFRRQSSEMEENL